MSLLEKGRVLLMSIINVTPDSFSGDGILDTNEAVARALEHARKGADILDIGGESTRPGSTPLSSEEEYARVIPVIERLAKETSLPISIDTSKAVVAERALAAGASIINDVWSGQKDPDLLKVAAKNNVPIILMHNASDRAEVERSALGGSYRGISYTDVIADISRELLQIVEKALASGITRENIILDPGFGFGKTPEQNLELLARFDELKKTGYPLLAGVSRKSFIGHALDLPPEERLEGTAAAVALAVERGAAIVRVHDTKAMHRVVRFTEAVMRA
jgi:dihydropteroate synthase